ncbi:MULTISPECIES: N-acetylmuramidase family protein [unclassified Pseudomonas]|uniref:N-acetylmuramidase family protein n=1 Tax=unclassified Pseudomonas TaxID=196821 RepID=UPI00215CD6C1|nr:MULTISPECIES: N-acetylmuramidase family protein [unclassified Pseudomonas]MCR8930413.1 N-acetylmuramidase family protein [Pseudomonas sp. S11A4]MCR8935636.1 N-acetylmuramidase family protein [Pseudomonas sp. S11A4]MCR8974015.1 N-acetylmuramidase family protein [Pseudomonas sp. S11P7]
MTPLRHGDRSQAVRNLQKSLNQHGAKLNVDGDYGDATEHAVRAYQIKVGLVADGVAGSKTLSALTGTDCQQLLKNADLVNAAERLSVPLASVYAVNEVESKGAGFLDNGKPVILFERHIMYRQLAKVRREGDDPAALKRHADQLAATNPAIVNPKSGGYAGGSAEHQRLATARLIDDTAALESASWGAFQIMGFHWPRLGYNSVQEFVAAMSAGESQQFDAFVRFIETDPVLHKALKGRKWAEFAKLYNGPDYQRNLYDIKLQRAYERHDDCGCGQAVAA